ncbi:hypothetical protein DFH07DRAFT_724057, partial [Mycena maculata]
GGKAGRHDWVEQVPGIGKILYVLAQTFEHSGGHSFRRIHHVTSMLGVSRFAHLPSGSILIRIPNTVNLTLSTAEITRAATTLFNRLLAECEALAQMITALNMVQRK